MTAEEERQLASVALKHAKMLEAEDNVSGLAKAAADHLHYLKMQSLARSNLSVH